MYVCSAAQVFVKQNTPETQRLPGCIHPNGWKKSSLGELRRASCRFEAVFFPFFHTRVTGEEPGLLENGAELRVELEERSGQAVADCASLSGNAAAGDGADDVELALRLGECEGLADDQLEGIEAEVIIDRATVERCVEPVPW